MPFSGVLAIACAQSFRTQLARPGTAQTLPGTSLTVLKPRYVIRSSLLGLLFALSTGCAHGVATPAAADVRDGQPIGQSRPTPLYSPKFVVRGTAADAQHLYVSGLRFADGDGGAAPGGVLPTGVIVKIPLVGMPEVLAEGAFIPMTTLRLVDDRLYWHERHDSPDGRGIRSLSLDGSELERISDLAGDSWVIKPDVVFFTRPDDEIDEGGFYRLDRGTSKPKLVARRRGVARTLLAGPSDEALYWTTRARRDKTWAVYAWDGANSGTEVLASDETFASIAIDGDDFLWVTWAEDEGAPLHSLYQRPIAGGDTQVLARKRGMPGFMDVLADEQWIYLTTVEGGELRRMPKQGGELEVLLGSGDRNVAINRFNLFWVDAKQVRWMRK